MKRVLPWIAATPLLLLQGCSPPPPTPETPPRPLPPPASAAPAPAPTPEPAPAPAPVPPPLAVEAVPFVSLGATTCVARGDGLWRCWGSNAYAALGGAVKAETCGTKPYPVSCVRSPVDLAGAKGAVALAGNGETFCSLGKDGQVACWGRERDGTLGPSRENLSVCNYGGDVLAGCTNNSADARCAPDRTARCATAPRPIAGITGAALKSGSGFFCVLRGDGGASCWGGNFRGKLGISKSDQQECGSLPKGTFVVGGTGFECSPTPKPVQGLTGLVELATGGEFGAARSSDGRVFTWGFNIAGQLGRGGSSAPAELPEARGATALALGSSFACARKADGTVACWGSHSSGEAGVGKRPADEYGVINLVSPEPVPGLKGVRSLATHELASHVCALRDDATVACWGANEMGQLGTGDKRNRDTPTAVPGLKNVARVVVGGNHSCAQLASGEVLCWGANHLGQLGTTRARGSCKLPYFADSSTVSCSLSPVAVEGL